SAWETQGGNFSDTTMQKGIGGEQGQQGQQPRILKLEVAVHVWLRSWAAARRASARSMNLAACVTAPNGGDGGSGANLRWSHWRRKSMTAPAKSGPIRPRSLRARENSVVFNSPGGKPNA